MKKSKYMKNSQHIIMNVAKTISEKFVFKMCVWTDRLFDFPVREISIDSIQAPEPRSREEFLQCESQCLTTILDFTYE